MSPKVKLNLLVALSVVVVIIAGVMLKQSEGASNIVKLAWGFILTMGGITLVRGIRLYKKIS